MTRRFVFSFLSIALLVAAIGCGGSSSNHTTINQRRAALTRQQKIRIAKIQAAQARLAAAQNQGNSLEKTAQNTVQGGATFINGVLQTIGKIW